MSRFNAKKLGFFAAGITVALLVAQGCSSSDDSQAAPPTAGAGGGHAGSAGKSGVAGTGNGESGAVNNNGGSGNTDNAGAPGEAGAGGEAGSPPVNPSCVDASGCYKVSSSCTQSTNIEFLNACVAGGCPAHFDNTTLTKLNLVGTL